MTAPVIPCRWTGDSLAPINRFHNIANAHFVVGEVYNIAVVEQRSMKSHAHLFASVTEAWRNLPERLDSEFPTEDHFRKRGLIQCGFFYQQEIACATRAEAVRWMEILRKRDQHAVYSISGNIIVERIAKSQSLKAMAKDEFERSHQALVEWAWGLVGIKPVYEGAA